MLKKTQFQLIISYIVYYIYSKEYQNLLMSQGFIAWTRTNYKIELQITREKNRKNYLKHWPRTGGSRKKKRDLWFGMNKIGLKLFR